MTRVTQLIHDAGKYLLISVYPLPTHPTHNFNHNNGGNLETLPGWPKKFNHNRPARCAGQSSVMLKDGYLARWIEQSQMIWIKHKLVSKIDPWLFETVQKVKTNHTFHVVSGPYLIIWHKWIVTFFSTLSYIKGWVLKSIRNEVGDLNKLGLTSSSPIWSVGYVHARDPGLLIHNCTSSTRVLAGATLTTKLNTDS